MARMQNRSRRSAIQLLPVAFLEFFSGSIHFWFVMLRLHFLRTGTE